MPYHQLVLDIGVKALATAEDACSALGAMAVTLSDAGDEPLLEPAPGATPLWQEVRLRALFDSRADPALLAAALAATIGLEATSIRLEWIEDRIWEREWLEDFRPMRFGRRLWVCPAGQRPERPAEVVLDLDPGLAFGTGTHATTALCLEWLDAECLPGLNVLDCGCGSGILALAALKLGAASAAAFDIDPQALRATRENAARNGVAHRITVTETIEAVPGPFDMAVANILAAPLIELAPRLAAKCRAGARLALAGILERQAREVAKAYRPWFDIRSAAEREGWVLLEGSRRAE